MTIVRRTVLVALSLLVLNAVIAAASASAHNYFAISTPVTAKGGVQTFVFGEVILTCKKDELIYGGRAGPSIEIDLTPVYKECSLFGETMTITVNKLQYEFESPTELKAKEFSAPVALVGGTGASMKMTVVISGEKCEILIKPQEIGNTGTKFLNNSGNTGAEIMARFKGLTYTTNQKCPGLPKEGKATYEGNALETGLIVE